MKNKNTQAAELGLSLQMKKIYKPSTNAHDIVDFAPNSYIFSIRDMLFILAGMVTYITDLIFDCFTAYNHWSHEHFNWFYLTLGFIIIPSAVINLISMVWYFQDHKGNHPRPKRSVLHWTLRSTILVLQLAPTLRYAECLYYGWKSRKAYLRGDKLLQKEMYTFMLYEDADCVLLRIMESFLEAAPQLLLQLYILSGISFQSTATTTVWVYLLWTSCAMSLISMSWGVTAYFRDSRFTDPRKNNISALGSLSILLWQFFSIGSRVLAVVMLAFMINIWILVFCFCHYVFMFCWLLLRGSFMRIGSLSYGIFLSGIFAAVYLFVYINDKDEPTRKKYVAFYVICGFEHLGIMVTWLLFAEQSLWFYYPGLIVHYLTFTLGLLFMGGYYGLCHPSSARPNGDSSPDTYIPSPTSSSASSSGTANYKIQSPVNITRNPYLLTDIRRDSLRNLGNITPPLHLQNGYSSSSTTTSRGVIEMPNYQSHQARKAAVPSAQLLITFLREEEDTGGPSTSRMLIETANISPPEIEAKISPSKNKETLVIKGSSSGGKRDLRVKGELSKIKNTKNNSKKS